MIFKSDSQSTNLMTIAANCSNSSSNVETESCRGCGQLILSRYYLRVGTSANCCWHLDCLRCQTCQVPLDSEVSCYVKEGLIYCRRDYFRFFGYPKLSSCERCQRHLSPTEMVMRVRHFIFHPSCFVCALCTRVLNPGEHFGMADNQVYCRDHYDHLRDSNISSWQQKSSATRREGLGDVIVEHEDVDENKSSNLDDEDCQATAPDALLSPIASCKDASTAITSSLSLHSPRPKRARTSFKQHELRAMKAYFAMNHNPDAKNLRHLSNKTGLSKRVLQVWFQNARARYRRSLQKHQSISEASSTTEYSESFEESTLELDCDKDYNNETMSDVSSTPSEKDLQHFLSPGSDRRDVIDTLLQFSNHTEAPKMGIFLQAIIE